MKMRFLAASVAAAVVIGLAGCQPGAGPQQPQSNPQDLSAAADINAQPGDKVRDGGTFTLATGEIPAQMNIHHADLTGALGAIWDWYNPVMTMLSPEGEWSVNPDYITKVEDKLVGGKRVVTYTLNPKANFNDGTPIDWRAYETLWKARNGQTKAYSPYTTTGYDLIESVKPGVDDKQVVISYKTAWPWWQEEFNTLLHPKVSDPNTFNNAYVNKPHNEWGAGPYQLTSIDKQAGTVIFERNPKWWGARGKLDKHILRAMDSSAGINAFRNGEIDATSVSTQENFAQVQGMKGIDIRKSASTSVAFITLNAGSPNLKDPKVRKAVMKGIDRQALLDIRARGMNYTEELPGSMLFWPFTESYSNNLKAAGLEFDPAGAGALLDEAGWVKGADGMRAKDGKPLSLVYPVVGDSQNTQNISRAVQAMLKQIGVDVKLDARSSAQFTDTLYKNRYDLFFLTWGGGSPVGGATGSFCELYCKDSPYTKGLDTSKYEKANEEVIQLADGKEQIKRLNELEVQAMGEYFNLLPVYSGPTMVAVKEGLANYGAGMFYTRRPELIGYQS